MGAIVQADANDLGRALQRRAQLDVRGFDDLAPRRIVQPSLDAVEGVGASGQHGQKVVESRATEADDVVAIEDAGLGVRFALECYQSHVGDCSAASPRAGRYTEAMRWVFWVIGVYVWPCLAQGAVSASSASEIAREVREISLDPGECYRVRDVALPKDEARFFFTDGYLIFAKPVAGVRMSAVFTADVEGGDAEILVLPPNRGERRSLASYTGSPNLDEHLVAAVLIFSDDTYACLLYTSRCV